MQTSFSIINENIYSDLHLGFEIQSPNKEFISWDTTYNELMSNPFIDVEFPTEYGMYYIRFKYPVRIGNVIFRDLDIVLSENHRSDIAILEYSVIINHCKGEDYELLEKQFPSELAEILFKIYHPSAEELIFCIINFRDYTHLLLDAEYENNMEVSEYMTFRKEVEFYINYKYYKQVRRYPPLLERLTDSSPALWRDDKNGYLGIAAEKYSIKYPINQIERIEIERVFPAKGLGGDYFRVILKDKEYHQTQLYAPCYFFDQYIGKISALTGKKAEIVGFYYDC